MAGDSSPGQKPVQEHFVRKYPRFPIDIPVALTFTRNGSKVARSGRASEVSERGIAIYVSIDLFPGDRLLIEMTLPYSHEAVHLDAVVRSRAGFRYGLEFKEMNPRQKQVVARTCSALSVL